MTQDDWLWLSVTYQGSEGTRGHQGPQVSPSAKKSDKCALDLDVAIMDYAQNNIQVTWHTTLWVWILWQILFWHEDLDHQWPKYLLAFSQIIPLLLHDEFPTPSIINRKNVCPKGVNITENDLVARKNGGDFFVLRKQLFGDPRFLYLCYNLM